MELQQLRYVVAVAEEGSFTAAADRLGVAQPTVSAQLKALEDELGTALFHRGRGGAQASPAGSALLPWARQALADVETGRAEVAELLGLRGGQLALGATPSLATSLIPEVLAAFRRVHPGIALRLREAGSRTLVEELVVGLLDIALVILPVDEALLRTEPLAEEELVLALAADHPLAGQSSVDVGVLRDLPLVLPREGYDVREVVLDACREAGFAPVVAVDAGEMDSVVALTAAGLGAAVVPSTVVGPVEGLRAVRFTDVGLRRTIALATRGDRPASPAAQALAGQVRQALRSGHSGLRAVDADYRPQWS